MPDDPRDPGWGPAIRIALRRIIPVGRFEGDGLTMIRALYLAFWLAIAMLLFVLSFLPGNGSAMSPGTAFAILVTLAAVNTSVVALIRSRPLGDPHPDRAAGAYRTSMFIRLAISEMILMVGFVLFFLTGSLDVYLLGAALTVPGFLMSAPSTADIRRQEKMLWHRGDEVDLLGALLVTARPA